MSDPTVTPFTHDRYTIRRKFLTFAGAKFHIFDAQDNLIMFSRLKAFKLKEDIRLFTDESMTTELLRMQATKVLDISSAYHIIDAISGDKIGAMRRKGLKSLLKDEWLILDRDDREIGKVKEDSTFKALVRRTVDYVSILMPQAYTMTLGEQVVGEMKQNFNPFIMKIRVDFSADTSGLLDRRIGLAAAVLMCAIEGKQS